MVFNHPEGVKCTVKKINQTKSNGILKSLLYIYLKKFPYTWQKNVSLNVSFTLWQSLLQHRINVLTSFGILVSMHGNCSNIWHITLSNKQWHFEQSCSGSNIFFHLKYFNKWYLIPHNSYNC